MAEDEPHRLVEREQPLLVLEDEVVAAPGVVVVDADALRRLGLLLALGLDRVALLVDGEVPAFLSMEKYPSWTWCAVSRLRYSR